MPTIPYIRPLPTDMLSVAGHSSHEGVSPQLGLTRLLLDWHKQVGILLLVFLLIFSVTGAIYLFKADIENYLYRDLYFLPATNQTVNQPVTSKPEQQLFAVMARFPKSQVQAYTPPTSAGHSTLVRILTPNKQVWTVAVNPYNNQILGAINDDRRPMQLIRNLHGKLLSGKSGQIAQELAACWYLLLIFSGLYLWYATRPKSSTRIIRDTLLRRLPLSTRQRLLWKELRAVSGFWFSGLLGFLIITGMPWSIVSGELLHKASVAIEKKEQKTFQAETTKERTFLKKPSRPLPPIDQGWASTHAQKLAGVSLSRLSGSHAIPLNQILVQAKNIPGLSLPYEIRVPVNPYGVYTIVTRYRARPQRATCIHIDQYTGKILKQVRWNDFSPLAKAISIGVALHEGRYFGVPNQILGLVICLGMVGVSLTGMALWWNHRTCGRRNAFLVSVRPNSQLSFNIPTSFILLLILLCFLMPLMGLSLLIVFGLQAGRRMAYAVQHIAVPDLRA